MFAIVVFIVAVATQTLGSPVPSENVDQQQGNLNQDTQSPYNEYFEKLAKLYEETSNKNQRLLDEINANNMDYWDNYSAMNYDVAKNLYGYFWNPLTSQSFFVDSNENSPVHL